MSTHAHVGVLQYAQVPHRGTEVDRGLSNRYAVDGHLLQLMNRAEQHYLGLVVIRFEEVCPHPLANPSNAPSYSFEEFSYIVLRRFRENCFNSNTRTAYLDLALILPLLRFDLWLHMVAFYLMLFPDLSIQY